MKWQQLEETRLGPVPSIHSVVSGIRYIVSGQHYGSVLLAISNAKTKAADMAADGNSKQGWGGAFEVERGRCLYPTVASCFFSELSF